jgi:hypothetical protein
MKYKIIRPYDLYELSIWYGVCLIQMQKDSFKIKTKKGQGGGYEN